MSELLLNWESLEKLLPRKLKASELEKLENTVQSILTNAEDYRSEIDKKIEELREELHEVQLDKERRKEMDELQARLAILNSTISSTRSEITEEKSLEKLMNEINKKRIERVNEERKERRRKRILEKIRRRKAWKEKQQKNIFHVGSGYSYRLSETMSNKKQLEDFGLPYIEDEVALADLLKTDLATIKWLTYHREAAYVSHYVKYYISKSNGKKREITAPKGKLKEIQRQLVDKILSNIEIASHAHGFVEERSILTNAKYHVKKEFVLNIDLNDFFHSIDFDRVLGYLESIGYSGRLATIMAMICTTAPREELDIDGKQYFVAKGRRRMPQGAPTSPVLSNAICWRLDRRLQGLAESMNITYSRYADDISFSGEDSSVIPKILGSCRSIIEDEGFQINESKTRVLRPHMRQDVTGITVNDKVSVSRKWRRILRAEIHTITQAFQAGDFDRLSESRRILGKIAFLQATDESRAVKMRTKFIENLKLVPEQKLEELGLDGIVFPSKLSKSSTQQSLDSFYTSDDEIKISVYSTGRIAGITKSELEKIVTEENNMLWTDDVDLLDYLIVGSNSSKSLVENAEKMGVKCISFEEWKALIEQKGNISLDAWI